MVRPWKASSKAMIAGRFGVGSGDLDGVLDSFGAAVNKESLLREFSGRDFVHALGETDVAFIGRDLNAGMKKFIELAVDGVDHGLLAMARVSAAYASGEVNVAVAIDVFEPGVFGLGYVDGCAVRKAAGHSMSAAGGKLFGFWPGD